MCMNEYIQKRTLSVLWVGLLCLFISCAKRTLNHYPATLEKAIDLFFTENKTDSVLLWLEKKDPGNESANTGYLRTLFKAAALSESGRADSAMILLESIQTTDFSERDLSYYNSILGLTFFRLNQYRQSLQILSDRQLAGSSDIRCQALNERVMARIMTYYENYELAIRYFLLSGDHYREAGLPNSVFINEKFLAGIYTVLGSYDEAITRINEAEKAFIRYNDPDELYYLYIVAVKTYVRMNDLESAERYAKLAMESGNVRADKQKMASLYNYLGLIHRRKGNYREAIPMFERVVQSDKGFFGSERRKAEAFISLASMYNTLKNEQKAKEYALQALGIIGDNPYHSLKYDAYKELTASYINNDPLSASISLDSARTYMEKHRELTSNAIADFVKTSYELDRATREISQMKEKERRDQIIFIFILIVLGLVAITYYMIFRLRKKIEKASIALVKKNLSMLSQEQQIHKTFNKEKQLTQNQNSTPPLSGEQKTAILFHDFKEWLEEDKKFMRSEIDLNSAVWELGTNRSYLSNAINAQGIRFTELINQYRIKEVLKIFEDKNDDRNSYNLEEIAAAVGFRTKSVFFESFHKETGMTPGQFREYIRYAEIADK